MISDHDPQVHADYIRRFMRDPDALAQIKKGSKTEKVPAIILNGLDESIKELDFENIDQNVSLVPPTVAPAFALPADFQTTSAPVAPMQHPPTQVSADSHTSEACVDQKQATQQTEGSLSPGVTPVSMEPELNALRGIFAAQEVDLEAMMSVPDPPELLEAINQVSQVKPFIHNSWRVFLGLEFSLGL